MTYGFFLRVTLSPLGRVHSDENTDQDITLAEPIGRVRLRGSPAGSSFSNASSLFFRGSGYNSFSGAETAGKILKSAVQLASIDSEMPLDAGMETIETTPRQVLIDAAAAQGRLLLPEVHGLLVFEETGEPRRLSETYPNELSQISIELLLKLQFWRGAPKRQRLPKSI